MDVDGLEVPNLKRECTACSPCFSFGSLARILRSVMGNGNMVYDVRWVSEDSKFMT